MPESASILLDCLGRVAGPHSPIDAQKVEMAIVAHAGGEPLTDTLRMHLTQFLDEVRWRSDHFHPHEQEAADNFLRRLHLGRTTPRSSQALPLPRRLPPSEEQIFTALVREPHESMRRLYTKGVQAGLGTDTQRRAVEKMLWLRPLETADYREARGFLDALSRNGIKGKGTQLEQAHFLLDLLSPERDPHATIQRLSRLGISQRIRRVTGPLPVVQPVAQAETSLDDLLVRLSRELTYAADEGDTHRVEKLARAVRHIAEAIGRTRPTRPIPASSVFAGGKGIAARPASWEALDQLAAHPVTNIALMPLGVAEHILASIVMGELSWEESFDEALDVFGGAAIFGGSIWGTAAAWGTLTKLAGDKKLGTLLKKISERAPPRVRAYLIPAVFLTAFTYIALRQTQGLPLEEAGEYRWNFLEEMAGAFGVQLAVTGGVFYALRSALGRLGRIPKGKIGAGGVLAIATGAGMLAQEAYAGWRRKRMRVELKAKTYQELLGLLKTYVDYPDHLKPKLRTRIDRKFSILTALNVLDFPSVQEAVKMAENRQRELARLVQMGLPEDRAVLALSGLGKRPPSSRSEREGEAPAALPLEGATRAPIMEPLNEDESRLADRWIQKMNEKEATSVLPISMLPAQKRRILGLWERDLSDVRQFAERPIPLPKNPSEEELERWNFAHTMALFRNYLDERSPD